MRPPATPASSGPRPAPEPTRRRPGSPATAARPVFLDPSGRRQRRVRRLGRLLVIPAAGYAALLLSTVLGGPSAGSSYLPLPAGGGHGGAHRPTAGPAPGAGDASRSPAGRTAAAAAPTRTGSPAATAGVPSTAPAHRPSTAAASPSAAAPTAVPTVTHGRSTPTHPVPTHTGHGRG